MFKELDMHISISSCVPCLLSPRAANQVVKTKVRWQDGLQVSYSNPPVNGLSMKHTQV